MDCFNNIVHITYFLNPSAHSSGSPVDLFAYLFHLMKHKKLCTMVECASADQGVKCEGVWAQN
jgi:hypothetical protein